jgi:hypothetical protein
MAQITPAIRQEFGHMTGMLATNVLKSIGDEELLDRLTQARSLVQKSQAAASPADRKRLGEQAQAVLHARPRAEVERLVTDKIAKAAISDHVQAAELRSQARELLVREPPAVRRRDSRGVPVAKASAKPEPGPSGLIALYDAAGNMIYAVPEDSPDLIPIVPLDKADVVAKAAQRAARVRALR